MQNTLQREIRSFVIRGGRLTRAQARAVEDLWPHYGIAPDLSPEALNSLFPREAPITVEIGFGMGGSLIEMAKQEPTRNFIGIEVHKPGVGHILQEIHRHELSNLRIFWEDAKTVLTTCFPKARIDTIQIFFPDPWSKKRHHKRRLIQPDFVALLHTLLQPHGRLHLTTDWEAYAEHMIEVMQAASGFQPLEPQARPETKFEKRGKRLGHQIWDLMYEKT